MASRIARDFVVAALLCLSLVRSVWADGEDCFCKINQEPLAHDHDRGSIDVTEGWKACGAERSMCVCPKGGKIAYGVENTNIWVIKNVINLGWRARHPKLTMLNAEEERGVPCNRWNFKSDPSPGHAKVCMCGTADANNNIVKENDGAHWPFVRCEDHVSSLCRSDLRHLPLPCGKDINLVTPDNLNRLRNMGPTDCGVSFQTDGTVAYAFRPNKTREPSIRFEVCEGLTNQRIAIVQGIAIGMLTGLHIIMPSMHTSFDSTLGEHTQFSSFYNEQHLRQLLEDMHFTRNPIQLTIPAKASKSFGKSNTMVVKAWNLNRPREFWEMLGETARKAGLSIELDCTFNSLHTLASDTELGDLLWAINEALVPSPAIAKEIQIVRAALDPSGSGAYAALHVRIEHDWVEHCKKWENIPDGVLRDNCMVNTDQLANTLITNKIPENIPLYLAGGYTWNFVQRSPIFAPLTKRYTVVMKDSLVKDGHLTVNQERREWFAFIDYEICREARHFIGNSVSTFSAMLELNRLKNNHDTFHYNTGNIPLEEMLPIRRTAEAAGQQSARLKWIFSIFIGNGSKDSYLAMAKVAVTSAQHRTSLDPFCIFNVAPDASESVKGVAANFLEWLQSRGVTIIYHKPRWAYKITETVESGKAAQNIKYSPLYKDAAMMIATFTRFDIPVLGFTDDYVLYADVDVMFVSDINLASFDALPKYMLCGTESQKEGTLDISKKNFYANAGIILYNMRFMRSSHEEFINFAFSDDSMERGLHYGKFGPGDQGAYNQFYDGLMTVVASAPFNYKPYWEDTMEASHVSIVHWHGPKAADYDAYLTDCKKTVLYEPYKGILAKCSCSSNAGVAAKHVGHTCFKWHQRWNMYDRIVVTGQRLVKCIDEHDLCGPMIFFADEQKGTRHRISSCDQCSGMLTLLCKHIVVVSAQVLESLVDKGVFNCGLLNQDIKPMQEQAVMQKLTNQITLDFADAVNEKPLIDHELPPTRVYIRTSSVSLPVLLTCFKEANGHAVTVEGKKTTSEEYYLPEDLAAVAFYEQIVQAGWSTLTLQEAEVVYIASFPTLSERVGECAGTSHAQRQDEVFSWLNKEFAAEKVKRQRRGELPPVTIFACTSRHCSSPLKRTEWNMLWNSNAWFLTLEKNPLWISADTSEGWKYSKSYVEQRAIPVPYTAHNGIQRTDYKGKVGFVFIGNQYIATGKKGESTGHRREEILNALTKLKHAGLDKILIEWTNSASTDLESQVDYAEEMMRGKFCFVPSIEDGPTSRRFFDAVVAGCLPIVIGDDIDKELPLRDVILYPSFWFRIPESTWINDPVGVVQMISNVPADVITKRQENMDMFTPLLDWASGSATSLHILDQILLLNGLSKPLPQIREKKSILDSFQHLFHSGPSLEPN